MDGGVANLIRPETDVHIASSLLQARQINQFILSKNTGKTANYSSEVFTFLHAADTRLSQASPRMPMDEMHMAYFGNPENCWIPDRLRNWVDIIPAADRAEFDNALPQFSRFNAHYCARPVVTVPMVAKPFTKGMIAAACDAVPLLTRTTPDAEELLGSDYPYFVDGSKPSAAEEVFFRMSDDFGGPTWNSALTMIREIEMLTSAEANAVRIKDLVRLLAC